jgi:signal transduction histidine kinase
MFETVQFLSLLTATVLDTVLLLALADRRNRRFVQLPLLLLLGGVWLWHAGLLGLALVLSMPWPWAWPCLLATCAGALLMPCAMLHALLRLWTTGLALRDRANPRHLLAYVPLFLFLPIAVWREPSLDDLFAPLLPLAPLYLIWSSLTNGAAAWTFLRLAPRPGFRPAHSLFVCLALLFLAQALLKLATLIILSAGWLIWIRCALLMCVLSPALLVLVVICFMVRYDFLHLIVDRALVYAGLVVSILLAHQLVFQNVSAALPESYRPVLVFLEAAALLVLILATPPLRQRSAEALRYLLGRRMSEERERLRRLATDLSAQAGCPPLKLLDWFVAALRAALEVEFVAGWLFHPDGTLSTRCGDIACLNEDDAIRLYRQMASAGASHCTRRHSPGPECDVCFQAGGVALAVLRTHRTLTGLLVLGRHRRNRELSGEEISAVLLVVEQLIITLDNSLLQAERRAAEHRAAQGEKLSALGLLASSVAHEVKNPLSAIKTIVTVLAEDLGADSPHAEDLQLILGEVDRLAAATTQLLDFARPRARPDSGGCVATILGSTVRVLRHVAGQRRIILETSLAADLPSVRADELSLREIFFNLLSNALEATGPGGRVVVACSLDDDHVKAEVQDSGPGLAPEVRQRLFEPFFTTKESGTGLGLYVVGQRVRELGGAIDCACAKENGTIFTVKFPTARRTDQQPSGRACLKESL